MSRLGGGKRDIVGVFDEQPAAGPDRRRQVTDGLPRVGQVAQQGAAMHQVVAAWFERVGQDVVAADLDPGLFRVSKKPRVGVGRYDLASGSGLGGQPAGHRAGPGAHLQAPAPASGPNVDSRRKVCGSQRASSRRSRPSSSPNAAFACT